MKKDIEERLIALEMTDKFNAEQMEDVRTTLYGPDGLCKELHEMALSLTSLASAIESNDKAGAKYISYTMAFIAFISLVNAIVIGFK